MARLIEMDLIEKMRVHKFFKSVAMASMSVTRANVTLLITHANVKQVLKGVLVLKGVSGVSLVRS